MSNDSDKTPTAFEEARLAQGSVAAHSPARRRLIKLGSSAVPVIATLASQPALAWHCNSASAWGSAQAGTTASQNTRNTSKQLTDETWMISNWKSNTTRAGLGIPWTVLRTKYNGIGAAGCTGSNVKIKTLFDSSKLTAPLTPISGLSTSTNNTMVADFLNGTGSTDFQRHALVAQLNYLLLGSTGWNVCLKSTTELATVIPQTLQQMCAGTYAYPTGSAYWTQAKIVQYWEANFISVA